MDCEISIRRIWTFSVGYEKSVEIKGSVGFGNRVIFKCKYGEFEGGRFEVGNYKIEQI